MMKHANLALAEKVRSGALEEYASPSPRVCLLYLILMRLCKQQSNISNYSLSHISLILYAPVSICEGSVDTRKHVRVTWSIIGSKCIESK